MFQQVWGASEDFTAGWESERACFLQVCCVGGDVFAGLVIDWGYFYRYSK